MSLLSVKNILNLVVKKLNYDNFSILLLEGDKLFLKAAYKHPKKYDKNYYIKVNEGVTGYVAKNGKPQIINDVTKDKRYIPVRRGIKSEMAVPLKIGDNVKGVLNVESKKLNAFDENDLFLLSTVADQAAIAIQNATINKFLAQSNQKLKIINENKFEGGSKLMDLKKELDMLKDKIREIQLMELKIKNLREKESSLEKLSNNSKMLKEEVGGLNSLKVDIKKQIDEFEGLEDEYKILNNNMTNLINNMNIFATKKGALDVQLKQFDEKFVDLNRKIENKKELELQRNNILKLILPQIWRNYSYTFFKKNQKRRSIAESPAITPVS